MRKKIIGIVLAVALASVGTLALILYVRDAEDRAVAGEDLVDVFVVKAPVRAGTPISDVASQVKVDQVPAKVRAKDAISNFKQLEGLVAAVDLVEGEQLIATRFVNPSATQLQRPASVKLPDGFQEVTVKIDGPERVLGGQLRPGDTVSIVGSFAPFDLTGVAAEAAQPPTGKTPNTTYITVPKVLVTRIQAADSAAASNASRTDGFQPVQPISQQSFYVTFALDSPSVEQVVFLAEFGKIWLTYAPASATETGSRIVTRSNVYERPKTRLAS